MIPPPVPAPKWEMTFYEEIKETLGLGVHPKILGRILRF